MTAPVHEFDQVQIGLGLKPLAQHGYVVVEDGRLTLLGSDRAVIDSAPLDQIAARAVRFTRGQTISLEWGGTKYNVSPGWGAHVGQVVLPGGTAAVKSAGEALLLLVNGA